jgi:hypothetical protein
MAPSFTVQLPNGVCVPVTLAELRDEIGVEHFESAVEAIVAAKLKAGGDGGD